MKINKKAIACLLGGGVALTATTIGGTKLNDTIKHNNKVRHFEGLRSKLRQRLPSIGYPGWTMPKWEDDEIWKKHFDSGRNYVYFYDGKDKRETFENFKEFKDTCYDIINRRDKNFDSCSPSGGWCEICLMNKDWYGGSYKNEK